MLLVGQRHLYSKFRWAMTNLVINSSIVYIVPALLRGSPVINKGLDKRLTQRIVRKVTEEKAETRAD